MGVFESDLDIYLTNSAFVGLRMLGFRLEHGILLGILFSNGEFDGKLVQNSCQIVLI